MMLAKTLGRLITSGALALLAMPAVAQLMTTTNAVQGQSCAGTRYGSDLNCSAGEFTVEPIFSAEDGTPPFCVAGEEFLFRVEIGLSGSNADRYDIGFFVGETGNDPRVSDTSKSCSVATFPTTPFPWFDDSPTNTANSCGDYTARGDDDVRVDKIRVLCQGDAATGTLQVPFVLTYNQNEPSSCAAPSDLQPGSKSKCNSGVSLVSGDVKVFSGAHVDVTKQTEPDGEGQEFTYTASGPADSKVIVRHPDGTYEDSITSATNEASFTLRDGETARVFITALPTAQRLVISEQLETGWDSTAAISCTAQRGIPTVTGDDASRTITADLDEVNSAAACTITNRKLPQVTVTKTSLGDSGSFTFSGTNGWSDQIITTTSAGASVSGSAQYLTALGVATDLVETPQAGWRLAGVNCSGLGYGGSASADLATQTVTLDGAAVSEPGAEIGCTFTNVRQRNLTVIKQLTPISPWPGGDSGLFVMSANGTAGTEGGNGATASELVDVGASADFSESAGSGTDLANYTASYSCNTTPLTSGSGTSGSLTMPNADVDCTFTNTRHSATLTLRKTWQDGITGDTATVTSSGFRNDASTGAAVSSGNNSVDGTAVTVWAGESGTIAETFSVGDPGRYSLAIDCSGGSLSGATLSVLPGDTSILCTATNSRALPSLSLLKWVVTLWDPVNGSTNPKAIPGAVSQYTLRLSNSGDGSTDSDSLVLSDALPEHVDLYVEDLAAASPVDFSDGTPASGLTWVYFALDSVTDDLEFSQDGIDWSYVPVPDADGFDAAVRHIRLTPAGRMNPQSGGLDSWAEFSFRVRVR
ncbi:hypothetical protein PVT68_09285 [Microbulbifer bruguierae]|uniref:SpaA-like prealbumin fold domain-containing protein n=1 Tax=Microbulbifer bruguierae TaxID=3029061 RepID=A0ABY8NID8_9GAMM|nr:hypothetical protein [Microbulbifer bruguierae]WGL18475.1 hypothetical protein PVT68_09285 [Microbulbifer bruguierae]